MGSKNRRSGKYQNLSKTREVLKYGILIENMLLFGLLFCFGTKNA